VTISRRTRVQILAGLTAVLAVLTELTPAQAATAPSPPPRSALQAAENAVVAAGITGLSVEVRDENGTWRSVAGHAAVNTQRPPNAAGEFRVGSITKSFIATMVLQLIAEKRIQLDAPISDYLPGLLPYKQNITVHELLQHRSGLVDYANMQPSVLWPTPQALSTRRFRTYTPLQLVHTATAKPLLFTPGTQWSYSNTNYIVLGLLIEKLTRHSVATELQRRIIGPLGLRHTYLAGVIPFLPNPAEHGYEQLAAGAPLTDVTTYNMTWAFSAGAIVSTTDDLNRFYRAVLTAKLFPSAQLSEMEQTVPINTIDGYGLGLMRAQACAGSIWGHDGSVPGFLTYSFSSADGQRQITVSMDRSLTVPAAVPEALNNLLLTEFCYGAGTRPSVLPNSVPVV
jgi:D-alanyl-D-alanine carboxypeptidase